MTPRKKLLMTIAAGTVLCIFFAGGLSAQSVKTIDAGTTIDVRTTDEINAHVSDGRVYVGTVDRDVLNRGGDVAIPKGAEVEMLVKEISKDEMALDLESVAIGGERFAIRTEDSFVTENAAGVGANKRTGKFVGGGALIGAIIGGIAGGGKGAAIGAGAGAAAGASAQIATRGKTVDIPSESLVTFRLEQPLRVGISDDGFNHNGMHYHNGYGTTSGDSAAYQEGLQAGRADADRHLPRNDHSDRWSSGQERRDYEAGYDHGYRGPGR